MKRVLFFAVFLISGCATKVKFPGTHFSTPETQGAASGSIETFYAQAWKVVPTSNFGASTLSREGKVEKSSTGGVFTGLGVTDFLDLEINIGHSSPFLPTLKVQFLGDPRNNAKGGNFSIAARAGYGLAVSGGDMPQEETGDGKARAWTVDAGHGHYELMTGYRIADPFLIWLGIYRQNYSYVTEFTEGKSDVIRHTGSQQAIYLGTQFNTGVFTAKVNVSKVAHKLKSDPPAEKDSIMFGFSAGVNW